MKSRCLNNERHKWMGYDAMWSIEEGLAYLQGVIAKQDSILECYCYLDFEHRFIIVISSSNTTNWYCEILLITYYGSVFLLIREFGNLQSKLFGAKKIKLQNIFIEFQKKLSK